jgi:hypothetical protein
MAKGEDTPPHDLISELVLGDDLSPHQECRQKKIAG